MTPEDVPGIFFSFLMGIAFPGMGILTKTKAGALNLMWGNLLSLLRRDLTILSAVTAVVLLCVLSSFSRQRAHNAYPGPDIEKGRDLCSSPFRIVGRNQKTSRILSCRHA
jgi:hypothetical protein